MACEVPTIDGTELLHDAGAGWPLAADVYDLWLMRAYLTVTWRFPSGCPALRRGVHAEGGQIQVQDFLFLATLV
jgi:hypothetical protein